MVLSRSVPRLQRSRSVVPRNGWVGHFQIPGQLDILVLFLLGCSFLRKPPPSPHGPFTFPLVIRRCRAVSLEVLLQGPSSAPCAYPEQLIPRLPPQLTPQGCVYGPPCGRDPPFVVRTQGGGPSCVVRTQGGGPSFVVRTQGGDPSFVVRTQGGLPTYSQRGQVPWSHIDQP